MLPSNLNRCSVLIFLKCTKEKDQQKRVCDRLFMEKAENVVAIIAAILLQLKLLIMMFLLHYCALSGTTTSAGSGTFILRNPLDHVNTETNQDMLTWSQEETQHMGLLFVVLSIIYLCNNTVDSGMAIDNRGLLVHNGLS